MESPPAATRGFDLAPLSRRLDLPLAYAVWLTGFYWVARTGSWTVLVVLQVLAATRLVVGDAGTRRLFARRLLPGGIVVGLAAAVLSIGLTYGLYGPLSQLIPEFPVAVRRLYTVMNSAGYGRVALVSIVLVAIVAEEIVWRGRMLDGDGDAQRRTFGWQLAQALLFGALYGAAHLTSGSLLLVFVAFAFGSGWALLRIWTDSLWAPVIAHVAWDMAVLVVWPMF